ncbi:MAG: glucose-1-phosphate adenylyltransferase [Bacillota bacterium]|nr:glucose-1-phosphate adenylyltransferase [Bacillota bacterium]
MGFKKCVAMVLAGGQGSRLGTLTKRIAKPAVPFGGKYRIIDFTLSNCANSGIDTVGVLTQYNPLVLNSVIGTGSHWGLDVKSGGVHILPPYVKEDGGQWYKGTANAIYQNLDFIRQYQPQQVLVLSGDHIYKMDYSLMLAYHLEKKAEVTIAVLQVPWQDASRFGIMTTDADGKIVEFAEKPAQPKSNLASMGIYIFDLDTLERFLEADEKDSQSANDFGKNVIPRMLANEVKLQAYPFSGYWKDVGTIHSLWEANMDLLQSDSGINLHDPSWPIYSSTPDLPPQYVNGRAAVLNSFITEGCRVFGRVEGSILFPGVTVAAEAVVKDSIIMAGATIEKGARVIKAIVSEGARVGAGAQVGTGESTDIAIVG